MPSVSPPGDVQVVVPATAANLGAGFDVLGMALKLHLRLDMWRSSLGEQDIVFRDGVDPASATAGAEMAREAIAVGFRLGGIDPPGYRVAFTSEIPLARGLGSSAALRLACLLAAASVGDGTTKKRLLAEAARLEGHADNVAAALEGGLVVAATDGTQVRWARLDLPESLQAVVAIPETAVLTDESRATLPPMVSLDDAVFNLGRAALAVAAIASERFDLLGEAMQDRLHQPYRLPSLPGAAAAMEAAQSAGAKGAALSGSGPCVLALCDRRDGNADEVAQAMKAAFESAGSPAECRILTPENCGAQVINRP